jgi:hypothetical protein
VATENSARTDLLAEEMEWPQEVDAAIPLEVVPPRVVPSVPGWLLAGMAQAAVVAAVTLGTPRAETWLAGHPPAGLALQDAPGELPRQAGQEP